MCILTFCHFVVVCDGRRRCSLPRNLPSSSCFISSVRKWRRKRGIPCSLDWSDVGVQLGITPLFSGCWKHNEWSLHYLYLFLLFFINTFWGGSRWTHSWEVFTGDMFVGQHPSFKNSISTLTHLVLRLYLKISWCPIVWLLCIFSNHLLCFVHQVGRGDKLWWDTNKILGKSLC